MDRELSRGRSSTDGSNKPTLIERGRIDETNQSSAYPGGSSTTSGAIAQTSGTAQGELDTDIALLRSDIQAQKNDIVARSMQFTDAQAKAFWPLYRDYSHKQQVIGDQRISIIKDYASQYATVDDA
jgi:hypothetical protein